jgi:hypothetical protein
MSYFGVSLRNGVGLGLGTVPSLTNTPLSYRLAPSLDLSFAGSDALSPEITFSRTTNATVTGSNGLIQNAPMNLLTFSEQFDNSAWVKTNATVTANGVVAPNGTTTADTITDNATSGFHRVQQSSAFVAGTVYTLSVYAKQGTTGIAFVLNDSAVNFGRASFDLVAGTATLTTGTSANIEPVGDGWFRCSVTATATASGNGQTSVHVKSVFTYVGTGEYAFIWGAQLELGSTATTYNPTTVKNLLGYTEHFDNAAWTKSNASISATKVDDIYGQPFAQKLVEDTATSSHYVQQVGSVISGTPYVYSIYAKAGERNLLSLLMAQSTSPFTNHALVEFNLTTGTISNTVAGSGSITAVGNGWYRCSVFGTASSANEICRAYYTNTGDGTSGIYIFGAQLSDSASVDPYVYQPVAAPTSTAYYGPRFDYDPVTLAPKGLLIEEQRTNLFLRSEEFDNASWTKTDITVTANNATAPTGNTTADLWTVAGGSVVTASCFQAATTTAAATTFSVYIKAGNHRYFQLRFGATSIAAGLGYANFDVGGSGAVGNIGAGISSASIVAIGDGWYRCIITGTTLAASGNQGIYVVSGLTAPSAQFWTPSETLTGYVWGAQLEAGAFATSYIPTVASQVTRAADSASMIGNNFARWYNQSAYTVFAEYIYAGDKDGVVSTIDAGQVLASGSDFSALPFTAAGGGSIQPTIRSGGVVQAFSVFGLVVGTSAKTAYAVTTNSFNASNNGTLGTEDTSVTMPALPNTLTFGLSYNYGQGTLWLKRFAFYNRILSRTELQGVTA